MSNPEGEEHVVPMTRFKDSRESCCTARARKGDLEGRERCGEFDGVSLNRLCEGVVAILVPLTHVEQVGLGLEYFE